MGCPFHAGRNKRKVTDSFLQVLRICLGVPWNRPANSTMLSMSSNSYALKGNQVNIIRGDELNGPAGHKPTEPRGQVGPRSKRLRVNLQLGKELSHSCKSTGEFITVGIKSVYLPCLGKGALVFTCPHLLPYSGKSKLFLLLRG